MIVECLLLTKNIDIPGVVGKIGTILGKHKINISGYILSKTDKGQAFSVIRVENFISDETIQEIINLKEIISVQHQVCLFVVYTIFFVPLPQLFMNKIH